MKEKPGRKKVDCVLQHVRTDPWIIVDEERRIFHDGGPYYTETKSMEWHIYTMLVLLMLVSFCLFWFR